MWLDGKIVLLEAADPGFDFIFGSDIKGFVTKGGGPNSQWLFGRMNWV